MSRITRALLALALLALAAPASAAAAPTLVPVGSFDTPMYVTAPPGDASRLFVVERSGVVRLVEDGTTLADAVPRHLGGRRRPTASAACSRWPSRPTTRRRGCSTSTSPPSRAAELQVREYRRSAANPDVADPASGRRVWFADHARDQPQRRHDRLRARRLPVDRHRRRRRQRRVERADALQPARQGAADRPARRRPGRVHGAARQRLRHGGVGRTGCATRSGSRSTA